jgi:hypothetical protein
MFGEMESFIKMSRSCKVISLTATPSTAEIELELIKTLKIKLIVSPPDTVVVPIEPH